MKTLYLTRGESNILVDTENNTANKLQAPYKNIDNIFLAKEPMHVVYGAGELHAEADAEEGDIIITFYSDSKNPIVIVKNNEQWVENIIEKQKREQAEKERWAALKSGAISSESGSI